MRSLAGWLTTTLLLVGCGEPTVKHTMEVDAGAGPFGGSYTETWEGPASESPWHKDAAE